MLWGFKVEDWPMNVADGKLTLSHKNVNFPKSIKQNRDANVTMNHWRYIQIRKPSSDKIPNIFLVMWPIEWLLLSEPANPQFSTQLTWIEIKWSYLVAYLDYLWGCDSTKIIHCLTAASITVWVYWKSLCESQCIT